MKIGRVLLKMSSFAKNYWTYAENKSLYLSEAVWWGSWRWTWALNSLHFLCSFFLILSTFYIALVVVVIIISFFQVKCCVLVLVHLERTCQRGNEILGLTWQLTYLSSLLPEPDCEKVDDLKDWGERGSSDEGDDASCYAKHLEQKKWADYRCPSTTSVQEGNWRM